MDNYWFLWKHMLQYPKCILFSYINREMKNIIISSFPLTVMKWESFKTASSALKRRAWNVRTTKNRDLTDRSWPGFSNFKAFSASEARETFSYLKNQLVSFYYIWLVDAYCCYAAFQPILDRDYWVLVKITIFRSERQPFFSKCF